MNYRVSRAFRWQGVVRMPGQVLSLDIRQAGRLIAMGLVGRAEQPPKERAVKPPAETRKRSPRKKAAKPPVTEREETHEPVPEDPADD